MRARKPQCRRRVVARSHLAHEEALLLRLSGDERRHSGAQKPYGIVFDAGASQTVHGRYENLSRLRGWFGEIGLSGDDFEIGTLDFDADRARRETFALEFLRKFNRLFAQYFPQTPLVADVVFKRFLGRNRFGLLVRLDRAAIDAAREVAQLDAPRSENRFCMFVA